MRLDNEDTLILARKVGTHQWFCVFCVQSYKWFEKDKFRIESVLAIATNINRSTPNFLTFKFYYQDIIWQKIIIWQKKLSSYLSWGHVIIFCGKQFVSPHIFHCIYIEFSSSTFFWYLYLVLISVLGENIYLVYIFLWKHWNSTEYIADVSISEGSKILMILVAFAAQNLTVSWAIWLFFDENVMNNILVFQNVK